jgi:hypothetical protein
MAGFGESIKISSTCVMSARRCDGMELLRGTLNIGGSDRKAEAGRAPFTTWGQLQIIYET